MLDQPESLALVRKLPRGTQVIYVPSHIKDPHSFSESSGMGAQPGFVTSGPTKLDGLVYYFVRYWHIEQSKPVNELRTMSCSEMSLNARLVIEDSVPQEWVDAALEKFC